MDKLAFRHIYDPSTENGEAFKGFYLFYNNGSKDLVDSNGKPKAQYCYDDPSTSLIDESDLENENGGGGYEFEPSNRLWLPTTTRNTYGFLECSFQPLKKDGNNFVPLLKDGDYFILIPKGDYLSYEYDKNWNPVYTFFQDVPFYEQAQLLRVNQNNPDDTDINLNYSDYKVTFSWEDADSSDSWTANIHCSFGHWDVQGEPQDLEIKNITNKYLIEQWDNDGNENKVVTFTLKVTDSYNLYDECTVARYLVDQTGELTSQINKLWLTYKCINNPPQYGDYVYVYAYMSKNSAINLGSTTITVWTTPNTLSIASKPEQQGRPPIPAEKPNSFFNVGGRGTSSNPDSINSSTGVVDTTPANTFDQDRKEYLETLNSNDDTDYGIFQTAPLSNITLYDTSNLRTYFLTEQTLFANTMNYKSIVPNDGNTFTGTADCTIMARINDGDPVTAYQSGTLANTYLHRPINGKGYICNFVFKVSATQGTKVKIGIIPAYIPNDLNDIRAETFYESVDFEHFTVFYNDNPWAVMLLPMNNVEFTVGQ